METNINYMITSPAMCTFIEHELENESEPKPYLHPKTNNAFDSELQVDWEQWIYESGVFLDTPFETTNIGILEPEIPPTKTLNNMDSIWSSESELYLMDQSKSSSTIEELERLLFSSSQFSEMTTNPILSSNLYSDPNDSSLAPITSNEPPLSYTSPSRSSTSSSLSPLQSPSRIFPCTLCPRTFPKCHLLKYVFLSLFFSSISTSTKPIRSRHLKQHNPSIPCPHNCGHHTARNRDMERHITVHHRQTAAMPLVRFRCEVQGCGDSFTRKDNLLRHLKKVHGKSTG